MAPPTDLEVLAVFRRALHSVLRNVLLDSLEDYSITSKPIGTRSREYTIVWNGYHICLELDSMDGAEGYLRNYIVPKFARRILLNGFKYADGSHRKAKAKAVETVGA